MHSCLCSVRTWESPLLLQEVSIHQQGNRNSNRKHLLLFYSWELSSITPAMQDQCKGTFPPVPPDLPASRSPSILGQQRLSQQPALTLCHDDLGPCFSRHRSRESQARSLPSPRCCRHVSSIAAGLPSFEHGVAWCFSKNSNTVQGVGS